MFDSFPSCSTEKLLLGYITMLYLQGNASDTILILFAEIKSSLIEFLCDL